MLSHVTNERVPHRAQLRDAPVAELELEPMLRAKAKEQQACGQGGVLLVKNSAQAKPTKTREELAKIAGVSHDTVSKAKAVLESGNLATL